MMPQPHAHMLAYPDSFECSCRECDFIVTKSARARDPYAGIKLFDE